MDPHGALTMNTTLHTSREEAYEKVNGMVDASAHETYPTFEVRLLSTKRKLKFMKDFPRQVVEKAAYTSTHANIDHGACQFEIGELWSLLSPDELKLFIKTLLDNQRWFTTSYGDKEVYFIEY